MSELQDDGARPKTIQVSVKRTVNLGDYNSISVGADLEVEVNGEKLDKLYKSAYQECTNQIKQYLIKEGVVE